MVISYHYGDAMFSCDEIGIPSVSLDNIKLENNFHEDDSDTLFISDFWLGIKN